MLVTRLNIYEFGAQNDHLQKHSTMTYHNLHVEGKHMQTKEAPKNSKVKENAETGYAPLRMPMDWGSWMEWRIALGESYSYIILSDSDTAIFSDF